MILKNINKSFGGKPVLKNISFEIKNGERLGISGESGIGKTSLINIILGLIDKDGGEIIHAFEKISCVFQEDRLLQNFSAMDNVRIFSKADFLTIQKAFRYLNIYESIDKRAIELSGGMKRRLCLIMAILAKSDLIILDEPFKGIDLENRKKCYEFINEFIGNRALILISHDDYDFEYLHIKNFIYLQ